MIEYAKNVALNLLDGTWKILILPTLLVIGIIIFLSRFAHLIS